jgi:hypothetical protein
VYVLLGKLGAEMSERLPPIEEIRQFLAVYDRYAVNGVRPGLSDAFYSIDGTEETTPPGASLHIRGLRGVVNSHDALVEAVRFVKGYLNGLESTVDEGDPLPELRRKFHAPLHAKLDAALLSAGVQP